MKFNKLVRDIIPAFLEKKGLKVKSYICDDKEYYQRLRDKLQEEVQEFLEDETVEELADIVEVIHALAKYKKTSLEQLEKIRAKKAKGRGGFYERVVLLEVYK